MMRIEDIDNYRKVWHLSNYNIRCLSKCLFLDRDGVIIREEHYIKDKNDVELEEGAQKLIEFAIEMNYLVIIVTNQSGIGRGYFDWDSYNCVTEEMIRKIGSKKIQAIYANGYIPGSNLDKDNWRKPGPGMILKAINQYEIDVEKSLIIGDRNSDIICGAQCGIKSLIQVKTGHGRKEREEVLKTFKRLKKEEMLYGKEYEKNYLSIESLKKIEQIRWLMD